MRRSESGVQMEQDLLMDNLAYMSKRVEGTNQLLKRMMAEQDGLDLHLQDKQSLQGTRACKMGPFCALSYLLIVKFCFFRIFRPLRFCPGNGADGAN